MLIKDFVNDGFKIVSGDYAFINTSDLNNYITTNYSFLPLYNPLSLTGTDLETYVQGRVLSIIIANNDKYNNYNVLQGLSPVDFSKTEREVNVNTTSTGSENLESNVGITGTGENTTTRTGTDTTTNTGNDTITNTGTVSDSGTANNTSTLTLNTTTETTYGKTNTSTSTNSVSAFDSTDLKVKDSSSGTVTDGGKDSIKNTGTETTAGEGTTSNTQTLNTENKTTYNTTDTITHNTTDTSTSSTSGTTLTTSGKDLNNTLTGKTTESIIKYNIDEVVKIRDFWSMPLMRIMAEDIIAGVALNMWALKGVDYNEDY